MFDPHTIPRIDRQFRLQWEDTQNSYVLLYPEGMVKLNGGAGEILSRCDGKKTVQDITSELQQQFPEAETIAQDILNFLTEAYDNGWLSDE